VCGCILSRASCQQIESAAAAPSPVHRPPAVAPSPSLKEAPQTTTPTPQALPGPVTLLLLALAMIPTTSRVIWRAAKLWCQEAATHESARAAAGKQAAAVAAGSGSGSSTDASGRSLDGRSTVAALESADRADTPAPLQRGQQPPSSSRLTPFRQSWFVSFLVHSSLTPKLPPRPSPQPQQQQQGRIGMPDELRSLHPELAAALDRVYLEEQAVAPPLQVAVLSLSLLLLVATRAVADLSGLRCASWQWWVVTVALLPAEGALFGFFRRHLLNKAATLRTAAALVAAFNDKEGSLGAAEGGDSTRHGSERQARLTSGGHGEDNPVADGSVGWTPRNTLVLPLICSLAGVMAGLLGLG